jgi:hypothetical protein
VNWGFRLVGAPPKQSLQLTASDSAIAEWSLAPDATRAIPPGQYSVQAVLNVAGGQGWSGSVSSTKVSVQVSDAPATMSESQKYMKALLTVDSAGSNLDVAFTAADAFTKAFPHNIAGMTLKAGVLERQNKFLDARNLASAAIQAYYAKKPPPKEPPVPLLVLHDRVSQEAFSSKKISQTVPSSQKR